MPNPVVHLELHTGNLGRACDVYSRLLGWRLERVAGYQVLDWGGDLEGGVVECGTERPLWLPYVQVADVAASTRTAQRLGGNVLLPPREGPAGWRSVVALPDAAELGLWQAKA